MCRWFLASYGIEVNNVPHYGLRADGHELAKRRAICAIFNMVDINIVPDRKKPFVFEFFKRNNYLEFVDIVNKTISEDGYEILPVEQRHIIYALIVQNTRITNGFYIDEDLLDEYLKADTDFKDLARKLVFRIGECFGHRPYDEREVEALVVLLYDSGIDLIRIKDYVFKVHFDLYMRIKTAIDNYILDTYGMQLSATRYDKFYDLVLCRYTFKEHYRFFANIFQRFGGKTSLVYEYPLIKKTCYDLAEILTKTLGHTIPKSQLIPLCELFAYVILDREVAFPKLNICITSRNAYFEPYIVKDLLLNSAASKYIGRIDVFNFFYILQNETMASKYDIVLVDQFTGFIDKRAIFGKIVTYKDDNDLFTLEAFLRNSRDIVSSLLHEDSIIARDIKEIKELDDVKELIDERAGIEPETYSLDVSRGIVVEDTIVYIVTDFFSKKNIVILGHIQKRTKTAEGNVVNYVIFAGKITANDIKLVSTLLYELTHDHPFYEQVFSEGDISVIDRQLNEALH